MCFTGILSPLEVLKRHPPLNLTQRPSERIIQFDLIFYTGGYDLLAVRPLSERVFELACKSMRIDIISLDLAHRVPFYLKMPLIKEAIARGVFFEITYAPCLRDTGFF